ncbi:MAG: hypothetical protein HRU15_20770, partial [Planctomycetes bacterium]|nr:hypothetical protein [Planctomycetota bacterium]
DGIELFKVAKEHHILIRGILCTGRLPMSALPDLITLGFDDCIPKSMSKELLGDSVMRAAQNGDRWKERAVQLGESNDVRSLV